MWTMWSPDGEMLGTGEYRFGKRHGRWMRWYPTMAESPTDQADIPAEAEIAAGEVAAGEESEAAGGDIFEGEEYAGFTRPFVSEASFEDGVLVGEWTILDADGRKVNSWPFEQDKLHGTAVTFYPSGRKRSSIAFVHGVIDGEWNEWDSDGKLIRQDRYQAGSHKAPAVEYHSNGKKKSEGTLLHAREYADATHDWWNGVIEMDIIEKPGSDKRFGPWTYWYENGGIRATGEYADDRPVGQHVWWYPNGQKRVEGAFVNGQRDGRWIFWHENGLRQSEGTFANGVPVGHWRMWNGDGTLHDLRDYAGSTSPRGRSMSPTPVNPQPLRLAPAAAKSASKS